MKILYVTEFFPETEDLVFTGGIEAMVYYLVKELKNRHLITVLYRPQIAKPGVVVEGICQVPCGPPAASSTATLGSLWGRLVFMVQAIQAGRQDSYDLVIGTNFVSYLPALVVGKLSQSLTVAVYADVLIGRWMKLFGPWLGPVGGLLERLLIKAPWDAYMPISQTTGNLLQQAGVAEDKIHACLLGADVSQFQSKQVTKFVRPTIVCVARMVKYKRIQDLVAAIALVKQPIPQVQCLLVSDGPYKADLKQLADRLGVSKQMKFLGNIPQNELIRTLQKSQVFCLASSVEGFGIVVIEALAAGTPFVHSDLTVTREITHNGLGGLFFPVGEVDVLAKQLIRLLTDEKLYRQKQMEGQQLIKQYAWARVAKRTEMIYTKIYEQN